MSGPWDPRPGERRDPDEPDPEWPARDLETGRDRAARGPSDAGWDDWSGSEGPRDPATEPISRWDDWPPPPPEPEPEPEPEALSSDPWAESWEPEPPPSAPEPVWTRQPQPTPEATFEPVAEPARQTAFVPAETAFEPPAQPPPEPPIEPPSDAIPEADDVRTPAYEPYHETSYDDIGWGMPMEADEPETSIAPAETEFEAPSPSAAAAPELELETEPADEAEREATLEPTPEPEPPPPPPAPTHRASSLRAAIAERRPFWRSRTPAAAAAPAPVAEPEPPPVVEPEPAQPEPEPAPQSQPEPAAEAEPEPPIAAGQPEPELEVAATVAEPAPEMAATVAEPEPEMAATAAAEPEAEVASVAAEPEAEVPAAVAEPEPEVISIPAEPEAHLAPVATWEPDDAAAATAHADAIAAMVERARIAYEPDNEAEIFDDDDHGLRPMGGRIETSVGRWLGTERRETSTAEQAVPWLIGIILLLAGMVVVLMALIFSGEESLGGVGPSPSAEASLRAVAITTPTPRPTPRPTTSAAPSIAPTPTPAPAPQFGALEMVYLGRSEALAPIYLLRRDFTVSSDPAVLAHDPALDVRAFSWARDGSHGAALLADVLVSIEPGVDKRRLAETIRTLTFGQDASTVYAVRVTESGANDTATVLAIDFASGAATDLTSVTYARPQVQAQEVLREAQFADDGGAVRLFWLEDGILMLWVLGASGWQVDPATGATTEVGAESLPNLWSPQADQRVMVAESGSTSALVLYNANGEEVARTVAEGLVSHLRWAPDGSQVVFTLGRTGASGGVLQDLFMWNLEPDTAPTQTTNTGAAFGAEWLGSVPQWRR